MARTNKFHLAGWLLLALVALWVGGCTTAMEARLAFEEAEQLVEEENFDLAIEKYIEAIDLEPGSKTYKLNLVLQDSCRRNACQEGPGVSDEGKYAEAIAEYPERRTMTPASKLRPRNKRSREIMEAQNYAEEGAQF